VLMIVLVCISNEQLIVVIVEFNAIFGVLAIYAN